MSESEDYYMSWLGCNSFGAVSKRITAEEPVVFQPTDLSNCSIWLDGTDNLTITADLSNNVQAWFNKGDLSGSMIPYPSQAAPTTNNHDISGNNVIWFDSYQTLYNNYTFTNETFTMFIVTTTISDLSVNNYASWFNGFSSGAFSSGLSEYLGTYYTGCGGSGIDNYVMIARPNYPINKPTIYAIRSSSDLSNNAIWIDNSGQTLDFNTFAGYNTTPVDYYLHMYTHSSSIDIGELIVYNRALSDAEVLQVVSYLSDKWSIAIVV